jgi:Ca2+-dependent lipid-binding protein
LTPVWNETLTVNLSTTTGQLEIEVYDQDMVGDGQLLGKLPEKLKVSELMKYESTNKWFELKPKGQLKLDIAIIFNNSEVSEKRKL